MPPNIFDQRHNKLILLIKQRSSDGDISHTSELNWTTGIDVRMDVTCFPILLTV